MSAGPSPSNPGTPRGASRAATPSLLARHGTKFAVGAIFAAAAYTYISYKPPTPEGTVKGNVMRSQGVQNIEKAYSNAGATSTHTKAYGGSPQGQKDDENLRESGGSGVPRGLKQNEHLGDEQRPDKPNAIGREWKDLQYGDKRGK